MMNVNDNSDNINWDKLLEVLDGTADMSSLNEEELAMLASAREMKARLKADRFSEEEGWQRFVKASGIDRLKVRRRMWVRLMAAASLLLMLGAGLWILRPAKQQVAVAPLQPKVILKRANGTVVALGDSAQQILNSTAAQITADSSVLIYAPVDMQGGLVSTDTLEVPRGVKYGLQLPDGTRVSLNASSKIAYPTAFNGSTREVYVEGEAFFDVAHDEKHPFMVHAGNAVIKVLGTAFNIRTYNTGVSATLTRGKLQVSAGNNSVVIMPGEQAVYTNGGSLRKQVVDTRLYTAWNEGELYFDDEPLSDIMNTLSRSYNVDVVFDDPEIANMRFTLDMRRPPALQDVLGQITRSSNDIHFSIDGQTVRVAVSHKK